MPRVHSPWALIWAGLAVALALAFGSRGLSGYIAQISEPSLGARWIWIDGASDVGKPVAFWAVRDVELDDVRNVWLSLVADEGYVLWVNGHRLGTGEYQSGAPADIWAISEALQPGWNRLMIELYSVRGAGGLLATLRTGAIDRPLLVSDGKWSIFSQHDRALFAGSLRLEEHQGQSPRVWGTPPVGRWQLVDQLRPRRLPVWDWRPQITHRPERLRHPSSDAPWTDLAVQSGRPTPSRWPRVGNQVVVDFGRRVTGHLALGLDPKAQEALLFFSDDPPSSEVSFADQRPDAVMVPIPGRGEWRDPMTRAFRYVTIIGAAPTGWLHVEASSSEVASGEAAFKAAPAGRRGVFGLAKAQRHDRAEELVWGRLQGIPAPKP